MFYFNTYRSSGNLRFYVKQCKYNHLQLKAMEKLQAKLDFIIIHTIFFDIHENYVNSDKYLIVMI